MQGGGVQGLLAEGDLDADEEKMVEEEFKALYNADSQLQQLLGGAESLQALTVKDKYQIIVAYKKGGGVKGLIEDEDAEDEPSLIEHNGQKFKRVQIEGENEEYLMDEAGNIYDLNFQYVGQANGSDEETA